METLKKTNSIETVSYSEAFRDEWNEFVENRALNSTFLHSRSFFDHNPNNSKDDSSLIFCKEREVIAVLPANLYKINGKCILNSHMRATYGGIIVGHKVGVEEAVLIVGQIISFGKQNGVDQIIVRNPFKIYNSIICDEIDYAMWYHGFEIKSRELEIAIPLTGNTKDFYHPNTLRNVRKASGLVEVTISTDYAEYWSLLERCLMTQHNIQPIHNLDSINILRDRVGGSKILLFVAHYKNRMIGGIVLFFANEFVIHAQYIASDSDFKHLCPVHAIIDHVIDWGIKRNIKYLNLGMANENEGRKINFGLFRFKESFGGRGILRETMCLSL